MHSRGGGAFIGLHRRVGASLIAAGLLAAACSGATQPTSASLGMRVGGGFFDGAAFVEAEEWLGRDIAWTVQFSGRQSQQDMNGSVFGLLAGEEADLSTFAARLSLSLTVPLGFGEANARTREGRERVSTTLTAVAAGDFDASYHRLASRLVEAGFGDAVIRLGHEFNGSWAPWSSRTNESLFIAAWQHVHDLLLETSAEFRFDWTATRRAWLEWGKPAYPGDEYVDIIGLDVYWRVQDGDDPWDSAVWERDYLQTMRDHVAFAQLRGKPVSYPEWGLSGADAPEFIEAMHEWLSGFDGPNQPSLEYHSFFDSGDDFELQQFPLAKSAYKELFG